ncbi:MAG: acyltransferase [Nitrospirae bacterium]|nr:acyltransferase [Nitrospirota bacterium]
MAKLNIDGVTTFEYTKVIGIENIEFGKNIIIDDFVLIYAKGKVKIGNNVHIASFTTITGGEYLEIGDFVAISSGSRVFTGSDDFKDHGFGNSTIAEKYRNVRRSPVIIYRFCIIGANSVILPGVTIEEGVTVGAGSVVTRDLKEWGIYIGNKRVGERDKAGVLRNYEQYLSDNNQ